MAGDAPESLRDDARAMTPAPRLLVAAACAALAACASSVKVKTQVLVLPSPVDPIRFRTLTVLPLEGEHGEVTARLLQEALSESTVGDGPFLTVRDRGLLAESAPDRLAVAGAPPHSPAVAAELGRSLRVQGVYSGKVLPVKVEPIETDDTRCEETDAKGRCTRELEVHCTSARATFGFLATLVDAASGNVVLERAFYGNATMKERCREHDITGQGLFTRALDEAVRDVAADAIGTRKIDERPLVALAQLQAVRAFAAAMVPHLVPAELELMAHDRVDHPEARRRADQALGRVRSGALPEEACRIWEGALALAPQASSISYDLGVCAEVRGKPERALELYRQAAALPNGARATVARAIARAEQRIEAERALRSVAR